MTPQSEQQTKRKSAQDRLKPILDALSNTSLIICLVTLFYASNDWDRAKATWFALAAGILTFVSKYLSSRMKIKEKASEEQKK
jgi:hypothetical protein